MQVGFGLISCQLYPGDPRGWPELYAQALDLTELAESVGLDSVWTTEHHFVDDGYMPSLLVMSAAMAARTERITIGTGVLLAPLHDPLRLAEDAATVQLISGGRLVLGLGLGWSEIEFEALGVDRSKRGKAMGEILEVLHQAWSGQPIRHEGSVFDIPPVAVRPTPSNPIPIWVGGSAEPALRRAAALADGLFSNASHRRFPDQIAIVTDERSARGIERPFGWGHYQLVHICDDPEAGWEKVLPHLHHLRWKYSDMEASATRSPGEVAAAPEPTAEGIERLKANALVGTAEMVAERILAIQDDAGVPLHFMARAYLPGLSHEEQKEQIHRIAEELAPLVRDSSGL